VQSKRQARAVMINFDTGLRAKPLKPYSVGRDSCLVRSFAAFRMKNILCHSERQRRIWPDL